MAVPMSVRKMQRRKPGGKPMSTSDTEDSFTKDQHRVLKSELIRLLGDVTCRDLKIASLESKLRKKKPHGDTNAEQTPCDRVKHLGKTPKQTEPDAIVVEEIDAPTIVSNKTAPKGVRKLKLKRKPVQMNNGGNEDHLKKEHFRTEHNRLLFELSNRDNQIAALEANLNIVRLNSQNISEQLSNSKAKLFEALNQNIQIRNELKLAQKCVEQETGEPLKVVLANTCKTTWRGRAQQICLMQTKLADMKRIVGANTSNECEPSLLQMRKIESQRRLELERTNKRLDSVQMENEELRTKLNAQRLRNTNLQDEIVELKSKINQLNENYAKEDQRLRSMSESMATQQSKHDEQMQRVRAQLQAKQSEVDRLDAALCECRNNLDNFVTENAQKRNEIEELNSKVHNTERQLQEVCGDFLFNCRDLRKDEYMAILDVLQFEKDNLLVQMQTLNERLNDERIKSYNQAEQIRKINVKLCRTELKYNEALAELDSIKKRNCRSQRIAEYVRSTVSSTSNVALTVDKNTLSNTSLQSHRPMDNTFQTNFQLSDLKNKLDCATERIVLLEENIATLNDEKTKDAEMFSSILAKSKFALRDHLLARKQSELTCSSMSSM